MFVTVGVKGAAEQGVVADETQRRDRAGRHAALRGDGDDRSRLARRRRAKILGSKMGSARPPIDVPMIVALYREGRLKLDELISGRYRLEAINEAVASSRSGAALRNVIVF